MRDAPAWIASFAAATVCAGCAGPVREVPGGFRDRDLDYTIALPDGPGPAWRRVALEGAALAFEREGSESLSLASRCGRPVARAELMARHLVIGLPERTLVAAGPTQVAGRSGWTQTFELPGDAAPVRIKTVTLVVGDCSFDWVLASSAGFAAAESAFDAWWGSFALDPRYDGLPVP